MESSRKKERAEEKPKDTKKSGQIFQMRQKNMSAMASSEIDNPMLNHMKAEIRKLYGEKVNMVNTNYILKPHEFKCIAKALSKSIWNEEKRIETVDEMVYAVDLLCNSEKHIGKSGGEEKEGQAVNSKEILTTVRFIASSIRSLVPQKEEGSSRDIASSTSVNLSDLKYLMDSLTRLQQEIAAAGHSTVESLVGERNRLKKTISSITEAFSLSPSDEVVGVLKNMQISKERGYVDALKLKEKNAECMKRSFEEKEHELLEKISYLKNENRLLRERLSEREDRTAEVLERGDALEQNILEIKKVLAEEERRIEEERQEYKKVKRTLIEYNKKMAHIVHDLVERIKKEQSERDRLVSLDGDLEEEEV